MRCLLTRKIKESQAIYKGCGKLLQTIHSNIYYIKQSLYNLYSVNYTLNTIHSNIHIIKYSFDTIYSNIDTNNQYTYIYTGISILYTQSYLKGNLKAKTSFKTLFKAQFKPCIQITRLESKHLYKTLSILLFKAFANTD